MTLLNSTTRVPSRLPVAPKSIEEAARSYPGDVDLDRRFSALPISQTYSGHAILETGKVLSTYGQRALYFGNPHGLFVPFLADALKNGFVNHSLKILNVDFHADIDPYTEFVTCHTASWQRFGVDQGWWSVNGSFNCRPAHSNATPVSSFSPSQYIRDVPLSEALVNGPFSVVSLDLDYFIKAAQVEEALRGDFAIIEGLVSASPVTMMFSSSGWTSPEDREVIRKISQKIWSRFQ